MELNPLFKFIQVHRLEGCKPDGPGQHLVFPKPYTLLSEIPYDHKWLSVVSLEDAFWTCIWQRKVGTCLPLNGKIQRPKESSSTIDYPPGRFTEVSSHFHTTETKEQFIQTMSWVSPLLFFFSLRIQDIHAHTPVPKTKKGLKTTLEPSGVL